MKTHQVHKHLFSRLDILLIAHPLIVPAALGSSTSKDIRIKRENQADHAESYVVAKLLTCGFANLPRKGHGSPVLASFLRNTAML